ncbi:MAG: serine dehydratase beta chain, partial [Woeseiaceae bacterium]
MCGNSIFAQSRFPFLFPHELSGLGLSGKQPDTVDPDSVEDLLRRIHKERVLDLPDIGQVAFAPDKDLQFDFAQELPRHT